MSIVYLKSDIRIRKAYIDDIPEIQCVLSDAFYPYYPYYTKKAYEATVVSSSEIEKRMNDEETTVLVVMYKNKIVGTASIKIQERENLHIRSMAVKPDYQRKGIGLYILEEVHRISKKKHAKTIALECFEPLKKAMSLYTKFGFRKTGRKRSYHGIIIFEMTKEMNSM